MNAIPYQSFADAWESRATIRTRPRRRVEDDDKLIFPMSRQPLVHSQTFLSHCAQLRDFVLVQSLYKFINDVVISRQNWWTTPPGASPRTASASNSRSPAAMTQ